jgi:hypothetical protein
MEHAVVSAVVPDGFDRVSSENSPSHVWEQAKVKESSKISPFRKLQ